MDIVDTFNHLIPTEHLDDALFLGSNLENEVCEDFSTSQTVLEDSLKNMLSDKDPMLGSASNQFCLPVLDSNDPNFQMPCSTVVGLDDIMDEGVVKESGNDTIDEEELILPNRNLRDRVEDNSVRSPRKSPRLMAQEQVRSLRQSTIAKRSSAAPLSTKKPSGKTVPTPKVGAKPSEKCQSKEALYTSLKSDYPKESRRSSRHAEPVDVVPEVSASSVDTSLSSCVEMKEEAELDPKHACNNQGEINVPSPELNCSLLAETCVSLEEKKNEALMECKIKTDSSPLFKFSDKEDEQNDLVSGEMDDAVEERSAVGKLEQESEELKFPCEGDQITEEPESSDVSLDSACTDKIKTEKNEAAECNLELKNTVDILDKAENSLQRNQIETSGYCEDMESNDVHLQSTELNKSNLEEVDTCAFEPETSTSENTICDVPDQNSKQLNITQSSKMDSHETADLQDDRSGLETKNIKSKHTKSITHSKQSMTTETPRKTVSVKHDVVPSRTKSNVKSVKRNADEPDPQHGFQRPVKVRRGQLDKDLKNQSCNSGVKSVKSQAHSVLKKTSQDQNVMHTSKPVTHSLSDKLHGHSGCSKEPHHPAQTGHLLHSSQKQSHKPQPQAPAVKVTGHVKDEHEHPGSEHVKEEEKLKLKRPEKNLQPRQRRSSRSFSLDEPPLFIPDNIATVKRDGSDQTSAVESKYMWTPSKQCGFCKKPHGNRFMVGCGRCDDWFHGDCVGLSLSQAQQMGEEDKEYVCVRCCAEEDKKTDILDADILEDQTVVEAHSEEKTMECEKLGSSKHMVANDKNKSVDDTVKHKVKILKRESGEGKTSSDNRDNEIKKWQLAPLRKLGQPVLPRRSSEEKSEKIHKESTTITCTVEKASKSGTHEKQEMKKKKVEKGGPHVHPPAAASKPSADQIRQSVRHSLKDILMRRLIDSNLKVPEEKAAKVATKIEKELFSFFRDTDSKYKNKYRSLMFNLKDPKNNILFKKVLKGEVTPDHLIRMSPEELASKELAAWRRRENRHTIEMIEKEQREVERRPITKITHKGEIEIESDAPMKEQEAAMEIQEPSANKSLEKPEGTEKQKEEVDSTSKDTTSQHRQHLFDLNCKICIGRMAPPVDDLSPKNVKVVVGGARKHSDNEAESLADALSSTTNILASEFLEEEKQESPKSTFSPTPRPEMPGTVEVESTFLARLNFIWKGFINMPSVAKFVTKAYPVSGSPEYLTEDLPDSIQVGGRISPQTVWDYVEKIKASGTKEICVVRFTPVTEEDQISYTLLFAYFSSRKRYGVAANNMKQVKDMYLIPLGAADKIPHPLVPFDGPGLELHRPNLLLGLIIRQKLKRQHSASAGPSHTAETPETAPVGLPPDKKGKMESSTEETAEEENDFFNSFTTVLHKQRNKAPQPLQEDLPTTAEPLLEVSKQEPPKPLRFLPGVLIGWENQPSTLELANKPLPVDDILQSLLGTTGQVYEQAQPAVEQSTLKEIPFISDQTNPKVEKIDKVEVTEGEAKEIKVKVDNSSESTGKNSGGEESSLVGSSSNSPGPLVSLSLRGKPPDVSTEAFLTNLSIPSKQEETVENKERTLKRQLLQDQESNVQDNRTSSDSPCRPSTGKGNIDGNVSCSENLAANTRSPQFINLKRDPRQAAGRNQQATSESRDAESCRNGDRPALPGPSHNQELLAEPVSGEGKLSSVEKNSCGEPNDDPEAAQNSSSVENFNSSQAEQANPLQEDILTQNIETVHPFRRGSTTASSQFEAGSTCQSEFPSKSINFSSRSTSPRASANFSPMRPQQPSLQHLKSSPPGFPFPGPPNFPPQSVFGFPPHLPPPLLPPPGFGFPQNPMVPWPPVHLPGQPQRMMGPLSQASRYMGPQNFYQVKDIRRPERRHSDPWGRQDQQQLDRPFNRGKGDRQRFYSDSHHVKRERHDKEWEQESERHRHRDRSQEKDRDRKSKEEGHKDKERARASHSDRATDGKAGRESKNADKRPDQDKEKEREKNKHREGEKDRERYPKDRDHTDRAKSKR
ncbi:PHD finger protein 3 isoform X1 [Peromyscus californicus insignis]|uniref:PHD finger protein 3 isoform X1 n=5 Tax=Peromyscus californicus insignis TaxID=564181 RepID=UPI0022A80288|nr:PHD finger protein 3 isoform X1 [Peromyscus californicus insignis]XP_052601206.1 PHD finger protein 3 isoform X1 [Peromyscus californicus insignis]